MYKWHLERGNNKFTCPHCGAEKRFRRYVYEHNEEYIDERVGICDRKNNCTYHYTPKQFFEDTGLTPNFPMSFQRKIYTPDYKKNKITPKKTQHKLCTIDSKHVEQAFGLDSSFGIFLKSMFSEAELENMMNLYLLGAIDNNDGKEADVIFWQIDKNYKVRTGKIMKYNSLTGKRIKNKINSISWIHKAKGIPIEPPIDWKLTQCLFGEHLVGMFPQKEICLVESEKTAVIASICFPEHIWLSCGGAENFNSTMIESLRGKQIDVFADLDKVEVWRQKAIKIERECGCKLCFNNSLEEIASQEDREIGLDLADFLLRGQKPILQ